MKKNNPKGKFIVIDGTDGSGKATQTKLLARNIRKKGRKVKVIDFPRYYNNFFGKMIGECLIGLNGDWAKLDPKIASILYAADRWESSEKIKKWIDDGFFVIADRYASSNQIHQGGKISNPKKRREFLRWLEELEFKVFKIPKPNIVVYLDVPYKQSRDLMKKEDKSLKKRYQRGKKDLHETDPDHLINAKKSAMSLVKKQNNWIKINCTKKKQLMSKEDISELVWSNINKYVR